MDLYLQDAQAPITAPSLGSNDLEQLKEEIRSLKEKNKDLSDKLTQSEAKSTQTIKTGEAASSKGKSKLTSIDLSWDEEGNWADMPEDEDPFIAQHWRFQRDYFKELPYHTIELTHYEAVVQKVGRHLYP